MCRPIREAVQNRWNSCLNACTSVGQHLTTIFSEGNDPGEGEGLFRKSFGLVWEYFQTLMTSDENKSTLLLIAPPYRRMEILECVLKILVTSEMSPAEFMTAEEIRNAWETRTQVMLCFRSKSGALRRVAYTPRVDDVRDGEYSYHYGRTGKCWFKPEKAIVLRAEYCRKDGRITNPNHCIRGRDENLFGDHGFVKLNKPIVIVGNKSGESVAMLKKLTIGGKSMWDTFSAIELAGDGGCASQASGNGVPSIIVANDYGRLGPYFEMTEGRYDQFHCVIFDDNEQIKANGTDGMKDQVVIRSSETIIRNLFHDPVSFKVRYKNVVRNGCLFVWDRGLDRALRDEYAICEKEVTVVSHERNKDIWDSLAHRIGTLRKRVDELQDEKIFPGICWVYKQLHLPKVDVQECSEILESFETKDPDALSLIEDLKVLVDDCSDGESEKMAALKSFLGHTVRPEWKVRILSRIDDASVMSLVRYGQSLSVPCNVQRVSTPCDVPVRTIGYRKMSTVVANRFWLFDIPRTNLHWFLYQDEIDALNGHGELLDDLETRQVVDRCYRAQVLGVAKELLFEYEAPTVETAKDAVTPSDINEASRGGTDRAISPEEHSLRDSIERFLARDVCERIRDNRRESSHTEGGGVRIRFDDNTRANYVRSKVLILEGDKRSEVEASKLIAGQKVFLVRPELARQRAEKLYGSPEDAAERWRKLLRQMMKQSCHLDYLASQISGEARRLGLDRDVSQSDLRRYGTTIDNATELPYNSTSKATILFRAIGIIGNDKELSDEQYARGLAGVIQDAHSKNRSKGRGFMEALRRDWLAGSDAVADCFSEKTVLESYEIDDEDILTEE